MEHYLDKWGLNYEDLLRTQREHLDALRLVLLPDVYEELAFWCDTVTHAAPPPDVQSLDCHHSSSLHYVPRGSELTQWVLQLGRNRQLL